MHPPLRFRTLAPCALSALALVACAQRSEGGGPPLAPGAQRVVVTTVVEWPSAGEVATRLASIGGVPVRDADNDSPRNYRMTLDCADADTCRDAIRRIAEARTFVQFIAVDNRQRVPRKPDREAAR